MTDVDMDGYDAQDGAEVLDESNLTEAGEDMVTFEEIEDDHVQDLTQLIGDTDDQAAEALDADEFEDGAVDDEDIETDEDSPDEVSDFVVDEDEDDPMLDDPDTLDGVAELGEDEVELEYAGDLMDIADAGSGAGSLESDGELADTDLQELGYQDDEGNTR